MNTQPINTPDRARGDEPAELDPAMVEAAAREWHENDPTEPRAWDALADDERGWYVETTRKSLSAAGVPRLVAEVERLRYDLDHSYSQREWSALTARATSAEQERDRLRAGIEAALAECDRADEALSRQSRTGATFVHERVRALLAGSGEQPGECPECGETTGCHCGIDWTAPVVPDSPDVRYLADRIETAMTDDGHRMPRDAETRYLAFVAAQTALAVVGQGVTAEPLKVEWGVVLDDDGSTDVYESREQAEAMAVYDDGVCEVVRIETWPHTPAAVRPTGQEQADG